METISPVNHVSPVVWTPGRLENQRARWNLHAKRQGLWPERQRHHREHSAALFIPTQVEH